MQGFAVIDLETTGFAYTRNDRICEVAVVLLDARGAPSFEDIVSNLTR